jgi:hypothetical protein
LARPPLAHDRGRVDGVRLTADSGAQFYTAYFRGLAAAGKPASSALISNPWSITVTDEDPTSVWERNKQLYFQRWDFYRTIRAGMGDDEIKYGLPPAEDYRDNELIGDADTVLATLRGVVGALPLTDILHSGPPGGIPIREEAYPSLKAFADKVLPELKRW